MTPRPQQQAAKAANRDVTSGAAYWLERLIVDGTSYTADRLACEMAVDLRTVRRWAAGQLTPSGSSIMHMRALWLLRQAAPGVAGLVWGTAPDELEAVGLGLRAVAQDPDDIAGRVVLGERRAPVVTCRRTQVRTVVREGGLT